MDREQKDEITTLYLVVRKGHPEPRRREKRSHMANWRADSLERKQQVQAYRGDVTGPVPNHGNKVNIKIK